MKDANVIRGVQERSSRYHRKRHEEPIFLPLLPFLIGNEEGKECSSRNAQKKLRS